MQRGAWLNEFFFKTFEFKTESIRQKKNRQIMWIQKKKIQTRLQKKFGLQCALTPYQSSIINQVNANECHFPRKYYVKQQIF